MFAFEYMKVHLIKKHSIEDYGRQNGIIKIYRNQRP